MTDTRENLIVASGGEPNTIPGVTIMGIKSEEGRVIYQNYLPFALVIQAALSCIPTILWNTWASDILRTCIRFVADSSSKICPVRVDSGHSPVKKDQSFETLNEYLSAQVERWEGRKFLIRVYTTKLMLSLGIFIFMVTFYVAYPVLNYVEFQGSFVCHVHKQTLVTCVFPDVDLFKLAWIVNIVLVDISIAIVVLQLLNVAFCLQRKTTFFSYFMGVEERKISRIPNDSHLISHFCYENAAVMCPSLMNRSSSPGKTMHTPLISLGSSEEELHSPSSSSSLSYSTAPQLFRRQTADWERDFPVTIKTNFNLRG